MTSQELGYSNDAKFFVFERCIIYTTVVKHNSSYSYENHFWVKDVSFGVAPKSRMFAELKNCGHTVSIDNIQMVKALSELKCKHNEDENTAEIDMADDELIKLIDGLRDAKIWRRQSLVSYGSPKMF